MAENIKLICFDLDDTLLTYKSWRILNRALGIPEEDDIQMWNDYNEGKISYGTWNNKILYRYLQHIDATREGITKIASRYTYANGVRETIDYLKEKGYNIVLISGSFDIFVSIIAKDLDIKFFKANNTFIFDDKGRLQAIHDNGDDKLAKVRYLESFCEMLNVTIDQCACIGDGANDIELFKKTGHGITFKGSNIESDAWKVIALLLTTMGQMNFFKRRILKMPERELMLFQHVMIQINLWKLLAWLINFQSAIRTVQELLLLENRNMKRINRFQ
ncbi:MAG TPA: HAD-IB family phosphatase [Candidatus Paceibacterota bacterium]|jgi:phosphoserine phosphatase|nr:HAD-IB family phosphatase [Candidatus Paceibacterota bacterium]